MVIFGISQSSGVERRLDIERSDPGVALTIYDHAGGVQRDRIVVQAEELLTAIIGRPVGGSMIEAKSQVIGARKRLDIEVRRNEVQLTTRADEDATWDIAVGLDDFQDALESVVGVN
jgi:hypothetical protein